MMRFNQSDWFAQTGSDMVRSDGTSRRPMRNPLTGRMILAGEPVPSEADRARISAQAKAMRQRPPSPTAARKAPASVKPAKALAAPKRVRRKLTAEEMRRELNMPPPPRTVAEALRIYPPHRVHEMQRRGVLPW